MPQSRDSSYELVIFNQLLDVLLLLFLLLLFNNLLTPEMALGESTR
jgi:hypothetical protein